MKRNASPKTRRKTNKPLSHANQESEFPTSLPTDTMYQKDDKNLTVQVTFEWNHLTQEQKKTILRRAAKTVFWLGVACFVIFFNTLILRVFPVVKPEQQVAGIEVKKTPVEIMIKDVHIDLPILPAKFANGTFETTTKGASYLSTTSLPGETGNSIIYAHNWWNLFGNLIDVKKGEKIEIVFNDKTEKTFTVSSTQTVTAKQVSILNPTNDKRITLFTCANFLDADRFVVTAMADK